MTPKRALIVDDSKSARVVLSRLLEKHDLTVDMRDSAEAALQYLRDHRPDVIFMDHVMSGMDGLSAVQAIKNDPTTASIPIMMYTSQDGEVYAGEARASGAAGVIAWAYQTGTQMYSSPAISANGSVLIGAFNGFIYALGVPPPLAAATPTGRPHGGWRPTPAPAPPASSRWCRCATPPPCWRRRH